MVLQWYLLSVVCGVCVRGEEVIILLSGICVSARALDTDQLEYILAIRGFST